MQAISGIRTITINFPPTHAHRRNNPCVALTLKSSLSNSCILAVFLSPKQFAKRSSVDHGCILWLLLPVRGADDPLPHPACQPRAEDSRMFNYVLQPMIQNVAADSFE